MSATPRQRRTSAESREAILAAANELLRNRPYRDLSVEVVMKHANLSRTIFYRHFDGLASLAVALLTTLAQDMIALSDEFASNGLAARSGKSAPDIEVIRESLRAVVDFFVANGPLVKGVSDAAVEDEALEAAFAGFLKHFTAQCADAIEGLKQKGITDVENPAAMAEALTSMNGTYLQRTLGRYPQEDPATVLETLTVIWARSLGIPAY